MNKATLIKLILLFVTCLSFEPYALANQHKIKIVTSFSILEDLVSELGGTHVEVVNLVGRNSDAHMYQPKPSDSVAINNADLVVINGLHFEGWISRLVDNSRNKPLVLTASNGVKLLFNGDEVDPHAWQSFHNIRIYISNITSELISLAPKYKEDFIRHSQQYLNTLNNLEAHLKSHIEKIPVNSRVVVTSHDAFGYLGREFGIRFLAPVGISLDDEASAEDVANIIEQINQLNVKAIFVENINNPRLLKRISAETHIQIGGHLFSDALSFQNEPANSYINMMKHNIEAITKALR